MEGFDTTYEKLWRGATKETRAKSKKHWLEIYGAARKTGNADLLQTAEHTLALITWLESTTKEEN